MDLDSVIRNIGAFTREAILVADADHADGAVLRIRWANNAVTRVTGYLPEELVGHTAGILAGKKSSPTVHAEIIERLQAWSSFTSEMYLHRKDGSAYWGQLSFQPIADEAGIYRFWIFILRDNSEQKAANDRLTDLSLAAQATIDLICVLDAKRRITWVNPAFEEFTGFSLAEAHGHMLKDLLGDPARDMALSRQIVNLLDRERPAYGELLSRKKDGTRFMGDYEVQPIFDEDFQLTKFVALIRDVTFNKTMELRYRAMFDETDIAVSLKANGRFLMVNRSFADIYHMPSDQIVGKTLDDIRDPSLNKDEAWMEALVLESGQSVSWERSMPGQDGRQRHFLVKTFRTKDPVLDQYQLCSISTDITDIREAELQLRESQREAREAERRLWGALDAIAEGFVIYDRNDRIVMMNSAFMSLHADLGADLEVGLTFRELLSLGAAARIWDLEDADPDDWVERQLVRRDADMVDGAEIRCGDGGWVLWKEVVMANGERAGLRIDISSAKDREIALREARHAAEQAETRLMAAIDALEDSFVLYDSQDRLVIQNRRSYDLMTSGFEGAAPRMRFEDILRIGIESGTILDAAGREDEWFRERMAAFRNPGEPIEQRFADGRIFRITERKTDQGDTVSLRVDITKAREQQRQLEVYAASLEESGRMLEERNRALTRAKHELEHASLHDALTGLANRRFLDRELKRRGAAAAASGRKMVVLHLDLDRFKQINDVLGHDAGDHVLKHVARVLRGATRGDDFVARVGGDEFVVLSETDGPPHLLGTLASRILDRLRKPIRYGPHECRFGGSIGIAVASDLALDSRQLLINADIALYKAKTSGRNRWVVFTDTLQQEVVMARELGDDILRALDRDEFRTLYQPQFRLSDMSLVGAEALLRWDHPERGALNPSDFIGVAEDLNVLRQIDGIVLRQAMEDDALWRGAGVEVPRIAVNISGRRLRDPELIDDIKRGGIDCRRLSFELLESIFLDEEDEIVTWNIDQLREMGVSIELDDFGSGHSSIIGLLRLKPHRIKIDRHFLEQAMHSDGAKPLIRSLVEIGHSMELEVVAEGAETAEQIEFLRAIGCDIAQGYGLGAPMTAAEFQEMALGLGKRSRVGGGLWVV